MLIRFFKKWYWYLKIRRDLKIGKTLTVFYKVGVKFEEVSLIDKKKYLNTECHKIMMKYDLELDYSYDLEQTINDFDKEFKIIKVKFNLKQI